MEVRSMGRMRSESILSLASIDTNSSRRRTALEEQAVVQKNITIAEPGTYRICVAGSLPATAADYVQGMIIRVETNERGVPISVLTGVLVDQAALLGVLNVLYGLHRPVLSVELVSY